MIAGPISVGGWVNVTPVELRSVSSSYSGTWITPYASKSSSQVVVPERIFSAALAAAQAPGESESTIADLRYEVMFLLEATDESVDSLRQRWLELGDSIVIVGGDGTYNCHIHTDAPAPAIESGIEAGRPYRLQITDLLDQAATESLHGAVAGFADASVAVVPVVAGRGLIEMFRSLGAHQIVTGGQTMNPSTQDLLAAVERVKAETVVLLPNNKNIVPVAAQVDPLTDKQVLVVPTVTVPQGLAAMVAYFPTNQDGRLLAESMGAAAQDVRTGEVTRAVRASSTPIGEVSEGDWLGIADGELHNSHPKASNALIGLLEHLVGQDAELVTLITGLGADSDATAAAGEWLAGQRPNAEIEIADGGQPLYPYLISVE